MMKLVLFLLRAYQVLLSPFLAPACRFYPSCSEYAEDAVRQKGLRRGLWLSVKRILKCHPWHSGGVDLVESK